MIRSNAFALTEQMYFIIGYAFLPIVKRRRKRPSSRLAVFTIKSSSIAIIADDLDNLFERTAALEYRVLHIYHNTVKENMSICKSRTNLSSQKSH